MHKTVEFNGYTQGGNLPPKGGGEETKTHKRPENTRLHTNWGKYRQNWGTLQVRLDPPKKKRADRDKLRSCPVGC